MGIKNIHIALIIVSILLSIIFGLWSLSNSYQVLGVASLAVSIALTFYIIHFIKKMKVA